MCLALTLFCSTAFTQQESTSGTRPMTFSALSMSGQPMFVKDLVKDGPAFVYFIRDGDGVNSQYARQLARILAAYPKRKVKWYGVINTDQQHAKSWIAEFAPSYDVLMDKNLLWASHYGIESSPALVLIGTDGEPIKTWSGYSGYWLKDINATLAETENFAMKKIDFSNTPSKTLYGSSYGSRKEKG